MQNLTTNQAIAAGGIVGGMMTLFIIFGIAIAVWAGLNIVNAIERKDIEDLKDSYTELQKQSDTIKESKNKINELSKNSIRPLNNFSKEKITSLNLSNFNTDKVIDMNNMFTYCWSLKSINLSSFNTSNVTKMNEMFFECKSFF